MPRSLEIDLWMIIYGTLSVTISELTTAISFGFMNNAALSAVKTILPAFLGIISSVYLLVRAFRSEEKYNLKLGSELEDN